MTDKKEIRIKEDPINYWEHIEQLDRLIRAAELKAGLIFSFHSIFIGVVIDKLDEVSAFMEEGPFFKVAVIIWFLLVVTSLYFAINCFRPKLEMKFDKTVYFFMDAHKSFGDVKSFRKNYREINQDPEELYGQLAEQVYIHSKIISHKFSTVQNSIKFLFLSFMWLLALVISYLFIY